MAPVASNSQSPRRSSRSSSTRQASARPKARPTPSTKSSSSSSGGSSYAFASITPLHIKRTINITVEISSGTATASHMDVSQYHMPVTTSCYSPISSCSYEYQTATSEYETATTYSSSKEAYPFTTSSSTALSSYYEQSSAYCSQGNTSESEYLYEPSEDYPPDSKYQQHDTSSPKMLSSIHSTKLSMLDRFLAVDSREDALVVEARAAIAEGRVDDESASRGLYGWESIIDGLL